MHVNNLEMLKSSLRISALKTKQVQHQKALEVDKYRTALFQEALIASCSELCLHLSDLTKSDLSALKSVYSRTVLGSSTAKNRTKKVTRKHKPTNQCFHQWGK